MKKIFLFLISFFVYINGFAQEAGPDQIRPCGEVQLAATGGTSGWWTTNKPSVIISNTTIKTPTVSNLPVGETVFTWHYDGGTFQADVTITRVEANANAGTEETEIKTCGTETFLNAEHLAGVNGEWIMINGGGFITDNTKAHTEVTNLSYTNTNSFEWKISQGTCDDVDIVDVIATEDLYITAPIHGPGDVCSGAEIEYTTPIADETFDEFNWHVSGGEIVYESHPLRDTIHIMWHNDASEYFINLNATYGGCISENNLPIKFGIGGKPELIRKGENLLICLDSGMVNYRWFVNEQEIHDGGQQFYYSENLSGNYFVETKAEHGCIGKSDMLSISTKKTKLFPNPVVDIINIEINNEIKGNVLFSIKDLTGKTLKTHSLKKETDLLNAQIPINEIKSGVYTIDVTINNKKYSSGRLIVQ